jgi:hypothetical protein
VGTCLSSADSAIDAKWIATDLDYGFTPQVNGSLGTNPVTAAGGTPASGSLRDFVGADIASLKATGVGLGTTTDAVVRNIGYSYLSGGYYDLRITADDGFVININSTSVAQYDANQGPTAREFIGVNFVEGLNLIELLYWEQGGNSRFKIEVKASGSAATDYSNLFSLDNYAFFQPGQQPTLTVDQDVVEGSVNRNWLIRTGGTSAGTAGADTIRGSEARDVVNGGLGNDTLYGGAAADTLNGEDDNDALFGEAGSDVINGGNGNDLLDGGISSDTLTGGAGIDVLVGGKGWDTLIGGAGSDTFRWVLADGGVGAGRAENPAGSTTAQFNGTTSNGSRAQDVISDYSGATVAAGGDVLDLRDLLVGELKGAGNTVGNLEQFIDINVTGGTTSIRISTTGGFTGGTYNSSVEDQRIVLQGVDIRSALGLGGAATEAQILVDLLTKNKLIVDGP